MCVCGGVIARYGFRAIWLCHMSVDVCGAFRMCGGFDFRGGGNNPEHGRTNVKHFAAQVVSTYFRIFDVPLLMDMYIHICM